LWYNLLAQIEPPVSLIPTDRLFGVKRRWLLMKKKAIIAIISLLIVLTVACGPGGNGGGGNGGVPSLPNLLSPLKAILATLKPTFQWASNLATSYDFYLGQNANPSKVSSPSTPQYTPASNLQAGKLYYWRVVAKNAAGNSPSSVTSYFVTPETNPAGPAVQIRDAVFGANTQVFVTVKGWNLTQVSGVELIFDFNTTELELANIGGDYTGTFQAMGPMSGSLMIGNVGTGTVRVTMSLIGEPVDLPNNEILRIYFNTKNGSYPAKVTLNNASTIITKEGQTLTPVDFDKSDQGIFLIGS